MIQRFFHHATKLPTVELPPAEIEPMRRHRLWVAGGVLSFIVLGHVAAFASHTEPWPFSRYHLYSKVYSTREPIKRLYLVGLTEGGREVALSNRHFPPIDGTRLRRALSRIFEPEDDAPVDPEQLAGWLELYERFRVEGKHDGPALVGMRVYKGEWHFRGDARNAKDPPDKRFFFGQYPDDAPPVTFDERTFPRRPEAAKSEGDDD